jgi:hypothetical protein
MKNSKILIWLVALIAILAFIAAGTAILWQGNGNHLELKNLRGQTVTIQGDGLYKYDSVAVASQGISQDFVTLLLGIPLLIISTVLYQKNLLKGKLLLAGTLAYFLYTYTSYSFGSAYNELFLVYVALFSLSLFAFILALMSIDVEELPLHFSNKLPVKSISVLLFLLPLFLLLAWLGRIVPTYFDGSTPVGLESNTTLFIQVLDLGIIVPLGFLAGVLLLKKNCWGYLLSSIMLFKAFTMGTALCAMLVGQLLAGVEVSVVEIAIFPVIALACIVMTVILLLNISERVVPYKEYSGSILLNHR